MTGLTRNPRRWLSRAAVRSAPALSLAVLTRVHRAAVLAFAAAEGDVGRQNSVIAMKRMGKGCGT